MHHNILYPFLVRVSEPLTLGQDRLSEILKEELANQMTELKKEEHPPYHMNYRVVDKEYTNISASFWALMRSVRQRQGSLVPQIRIGSPEFDNFKKSDMGAAEGMNGLPTVFLSLDETSNEDAIRQAI